MPFRKFVEKNSRIHSKESHKKITILRLMLILAIFFSGSVGSSLSYLFIRNYQYKLYEQEFDSLVQDNLRTIRESLNLKLQMNIQVATFSGLHCPRESNWPNCEMSSNEFTDRTRSLISASQITQIGSFPIVKLENQKSFETFAIEYYHNDSGYPSETGYSSFGSGIFKLDYNQNRVPATYDNTSIFSNILVPIFQLSNIESDYRMILYDAHSDIAMRKAMENVLNCSINIVKTQNLNLSYGINRNLVQTQCSSLSDFVPTYQSKYTAIGTPIYPSIDSDTVVGFAGSLFSWESILTSTSRYDASFNCRIESSTSSVKLAFSVNHGVVREVDLKDIDDDFQYKQFHGELKRSFLLNDDSLFTTETVYIITYYPSNKLPSQLIAIIACICCIGVTLIIFIIFEIFNSLIKTQAHETNVLLDSKRIFVRFISHEIRTPLNTVILGLKLLQENLDSLKINCPIINDDQFYKIYNECIELIHELSENSSIAVTTLNDLINYDKIESKKFSIEKKLVNIVSVIEKTVGLLTLQAKEKEIKLRMNLFTQSEQYISRNNYYNLQIIGDSIKLSQVIRNLVSNALKFTPENGTVSISVNYYPLDPINTLEYLQSMSQKSQYLQIENTNSTSTIDYSREQQQQQLEDITGNLFIEISDNGPGLSSEQLASMFKEGVQFNPNELQAGQGSGLGLWISREIVLLHNGIIDVRSLGLGKGSTFEVKLPVILHQNFTDDILLQHQEQQQEQQQEQEQELTSISIKNNELSSKTIHNDITERNETRLQENASSLIDSNMSLSTPITLSVTESIEIKAEKYVLVVDDAPSNRKLVCRILKSRGYICHEAENGLECVNMILSTSICYNFIILDYEMPQLDGPSAAKQLRENGCKILIIGVTGNVLPEDKEYFINHGANAVLPKPVNIDDLLEKVKTLHSSV